MLSFVKNTLFPKACLSKKFLKGHSVTVHSVQIHKPREGMDNQGSVIRIKKITDKHA